MDTSKMAVALDLVFGSRELFNRFTRDVEENPELSVTYVRGSVGTDGAWARLLLLGSQRELNQVVSRWQDATVGFARLPQVAA